MSRSLAWITALTICAALSLVVLEAAYRFQWVDLYAKELRSFNPTDTAPPAGTVALVLGDSFTAGNQSYVSGLRTALPSVRWVNGGISGSGVREALLVAPRRFKDFRPRLFIYQVYVGNDLIDLGYHPDWGRLSFARNLWWTISGAFPSLPYLRRRLTEASLERKVRSQSPGAGDAQGIDASEKFSPQTYSDRVRQYYTWDPTVTDDSIRLVGRRREDFEKWASLVRKLMSFCSPPQCHSAVLAVPHKVQVSREYFDWEKNLGASLPDDSVVRDEDYPFVRKLREALATDGVPVLNPLAFLRAQEKQRHVYFVNDDHLNEFGQRKLAEWLRPEIEPGLAQ